ncbi:transposase, partial [bacterium]|nr:transposase [bacterium]
ERYLQHVPPAGYQTIRHYGLYTSAKKTAYEQCAKLLADRKPKPSSDENNDEPIFDNESWIADHTCPVCGKPLVVTAHLPSSLSGHVVKRPTLGPVIIRFPTPGAFYAS